MFRLPDLPNAGYASPNEKSASDAIMTFMREVERERPRLLAIVCEGPDKWRTVAGAIWRGLPIDTDLIDAIYKYFVIQACTSPTAQAWLLSAIKNPPKWRERVAKVMPYIERQREALQLQAKWTPFDRVHGG